jgi:adenine phosphoribosyltransferase
MNATVALFRKLGAEVVGVACIIELSFLNGRARLDVPFHALVAYEE